MNKGNKMKVHCTGCGMGLGYILINRTALREDLFCGLTCLRNFEVREKMMAAGRKIDKDSLVKMVGNIYNEISSIVHYTEGGKLSRVRDLLDMISDLRDKVGWGS